jgi:BirA family biotin operon repressor/biotin-[acetyl-CoA-carboxylase] ligase
MLLPRTSASGTLVVLEETPSTNDALRMLVPGAAELTAVLTTNQTRGRGRLDRSWVAAPGDGVAVSVLVVPARARRPLEAEAWGWIPLLAGLAMARAVAAALDGTRPGDGAARGGADAPDDPEAGVGLKWPNDVQVRGLKVCGILAELLPGDAGVVVGAGVNLETPPDRLPTATSTSLLIEGASLRGDALVDLVAGSFLEGFRMLYDRLVRSGGDAAGAGLLAEVCDACTTIGRRVRVELPGVPARLGRATGLDGAGRLLVRGDDDGAVVAVAAGDITHLRYE